MPSTYTVNLGIEKPATGEQSGTWGDTTNVNFDILDQAINGAERVTLTSAGSSGSPNSLQITNGATSDGRNKWLEFYSSSDLGGSAYVQLDPNDAEKIVFVRNSLAGSQSVILFQGTYNAARDLEVPAGVDMVVKFDGGGASAATVTDVFTKLRATEITTPTLTAGTADINGGTVDGAVIGGSSAAAITGTTVTANTSLNIAGDGATVTGIKDEDDMSSNSPTKLATQQSIKAYVDSQVGTVDTWAEVLANGATSGSTNPEVTAGQALKTNTINETSAGSGVTIDSVLLKDDVVNATDIETSNISANDGTAAATIANSTGNFTITNFISGSVDINGGSIDGTNIGASSPGTGAFTTITGSGDMAIDTDTLFVDVSASKVGINEDEPDEALVVKVAPYSASINGGIAVQAGDHASNHWKSAFKIKASSGGTPRTTIDATTGATDGTTFEAMSILNGTVVFNEDSADRDFRVESNDNTNMLFVDATNNRVGVGTGSPSAPFQVQTSHTSGDVTAANSNTTLNLGNSGTGNGVYNAIKFSGNQQDMYMMSFNNTTQANRRLGFFVGSVAGDAIGDERFIIKGDGDVAVINETAAPTNSVANPGDFRIQGHGWNTSLGSRDQGWSLQSMGTYSLRKSGQVYPDLNINTLTTDTVYNNTTVAKFYYDGAAYRFQNEGGFVFNEDGEDSDSRVESNNNSNMLFVDASEDAIGIGTNAPQGVLQIRNTDDNADQNAATKSLVFHHQSNSYTADNYYAPLTWARANSNGGTAGALIAPQMNASGQTIGLTVDVGAGNTIPLNRLYFGTSGTVFNEIGRSDMDFRVESDTNPNMLMVNAGGNRVGIGRDPNIEVLEVAGNLKLDASSAELNLKSGVAGTTGAINWTFNTDTTDYASIKLEYDSRASTGLHLDAGYPITLDYSASGDDGLRISSSGTLQHRFNSSGATFNENSSGNLDFRVESDSNANMLFVDSSANAVGIGKQPDAAGNYALDVNGAIRFGDGSIVAGICYPNVVTTTRSVGSGSQWYKVYSETVSPSPRTVYLRINASGDNSSFQGDFIINLAGYNFQHSITLTDYQYYNVAKLEEIKTVNPGGATTTEIWVRVNAITGSTGTLTAQCSSSALVSSLSAASEPSATTGTAHLYDDSWPSSSNRISTVFSNGAEFADASSARFRRQDGSRSSYINHDTGGMNIATSNTGDNLDITVAGGSLDITLGDNYEMAVNEGSASADFRVESNDNTNMLFVDGSTNYFCIGSNANRPDSSTVLSESHAFISGKHYVYSTTDWGVWASNTSGTKLFFRNSSDGTIGSIAYDSGLTGVTYNTSSDRRLKENIETITDGTDKLMAMNPVTHTWKSAPEVSPVHGFIAQEMREIVPEAVSGTPDGEEMMSMDYGRITPVLVAALQDAHKKIEALEQRLAELEDQ